MEEQTHQIVLGVICLFRVIIGIAVGAGGVADDSDWEAADGGGGGDYFFVRVRHSKCGDR